MTRKLTLEESIKFYENIDYKANFRSINPFLHHTEIKKCIKLSNQLFNLKLEYEKKFYKNEGNDNNSIKEYKSCLSYFNATKFYLERMADENTVANVRFTLIVAGLSLILTLLGFLI